MSKALATINCESPIEVKVSDTKLPDELDETAKVELFKKLEFKQLLEQIDVDSDNSNVEEKEISVVDHFDQIDFATLEEANIHFELDGTNYLKDDILKFDFMMGHIM